MLLSANIQHGHSAWVLHGMLQSSIKDSGLMQVLSRRAYNLFYSPACCSSFFQQTATLCYTLSGSFPCPAPARGRQLLHFRTPCAAFFCVPLRSDLPPAPSIYAISPYPCTARQAAAAKIFSVGLSALFHGSHALACLHANAAHAASALCHTKPLLKYIHMCSWHCFTRCSPG